METKFKLNTLKNVNLGLKRSLINGPQIVKAQKHKRHKFCLYNNSISLSIKPWLRNAENKSFSTSYFPLSQSPKTTFKTKSQSSSSFR